MSTLNEEKLPIKLAKDENDQPRFCFRCSRTICDCPERLDSENWQEIKTDSRVYRYLTGEYIPDGAKHVGSFLEDGIVYHYFLVKI